MHKWYKAVSLFNIISPTLNASRPALTKCINSFRKKNSFDIPRNHSCTAWRTSSSERNFFPPIVLWVVQTYGSHLGQSLVSMVDEEDTQNACLWLLQLLYGQCGAFRCHVAWGHLMTAIHVALIWLQAEDEFLEDLSMMHWWQEPNTLELWNKLHF